MLLDRPSLLSLILSHLIMLYLGVDFGAGLAFVEILGSLSLQFSSNLENFWPLFLQRFFFCPFFLFQLFGKSNYIRPAEIVPWLTETFFIKKILLWMSYISVFNFSVFPSVTSSLLIIPSSVFFISNMVVFMSKSLIWIFYIHITNSLNIWNTVWIQL